MKLKERWDKMRKEYKIITIIAILALVAILVGMFMTNPTAVAQLKLPFINVPGLR